MARRAGAILLISLAVLAAGLLYFAFLARLGLSRDLSLWAEQRRQAGWTVAGNFAPQAAELFVPGVDVRGVEIDGGGDLLRDGFSVTADRAVLRADLLHPQILHITLSGNVSVRLGSLPRVTFGFDRLTGTVRLGYGGKVETVAIDGKNLHSTDPAGFAVGIVDAQLELDNLGATLGLRTEALQVPIDPYGLGQHLSDVTLNAALMGWPPAAGSAGARADIWRAAGGKFEISKLVVGWGPLGLVGQADMGLDQSLQPDGTANLQVRGYQSVLLGLGRNGAIAAAVIAATQPGDVANFDLRIKKSAVNVDRIRIAKLPRIDW